MPNCSTLNPGERSWATVRTWIASLFAAVAIGTAWASEPDLGKAEELVRAGRYAEAYELLEPFQPQRAGDLKFDYLLARAALGSGRPSIASFIYERILAIEPNYIGVRLEMGRAYLALGDYARAKLEFETVLRFVDLPPDIRQQALIYARAAEEYLRGRRVAGYAYAEYGFGYDSNPLSATSDSTIPFVGGVLVLPQTAQQHSDHYNALSVGGELIHPLNDRFSIYAGGNARGRIYNNLDVANFTNLDGALGLGYSEGRANTRFGIAVGRYWLDNATTRENYGVAAAWQYLVGSEDQIAVSAGAARFQYEQESLVANDFDLFQVAAGWVHAINNGRGAVGLTALGGLDDATRDRVDGDRPFYGARITLQNSFTDRIGAFLFAGAQRGKYSRPNPSFDSTRRDALYDVTAGVVWSFAPGWSLRPQIVYTKNDSNIALYEFDRTDISINVRKDF